MHDISKPPIKSYPSYWELHNTYLYFYKCMIITIFFLLLSYVNIYLVLFILQGKYIRYEDDTFFYMLFFQVTNYITLYTHVQ